MRSLFTHISHRLLVIIGTVVLVGVLGLSMIYANRQESSILAENETALIKVTESVSRGLSAIMIEGHAKIGKEFADRLKTVKDVIDYRIIRTDGTESFVDNSTVDRVNARLGEQEFRGRKTNPDPVHVLPSTDLSLTKAIETKDPVFKYETLPSGERIVTILSPIETGPRCRKCHEDPQGVRGIIKLTTSLNQVRHDIESTWRMAALLISAAVILIGFGIYLIAHRTVVTHLQSISRAMDSAAQGNLEIKVAVGSQDEIGRMAQSFNHMSHQLVSMYGELRDERRKLSTLIQGAKEGIVVTNAGGEVVLVNSAAQEILGKSEQLIKFEGFLNLFDDEYWMQESLDLSHTDNSPRLITWDNRILSVKASTIFNDRKMLIGSAALIRDITEEKRLEEELKRRSVTDGLTRLYNRRHFDRTLDTEFKRWRRYRTPFSAIMLDVDHFKKFNDTHGHECGDHVLISIAKLLRGMSQVHASIMAFRYGGEEMVLIAPNVPQERAVEIAENLRIQIGELVIDGLRVTVSIGVAGTPAQQPDNGEALLKMADEALYEAKRAGRNRVCAAPVPSA
jgi:diguanylate cyclase (GGDEF)-like protein/PAS domain S-box-containing protein